MVFQCVDIATKPHNLPLFKPAPEDIFPLVDAVSPNVPRFEPAPEDIVPLVDAISETFRVYQALSDPAEKAKALKRLASVAQALHSETNSPVDATEQSMNYTFATSAVRIAMAMGVFQKLPDRGSLTVQEMAAAAHADTDLMLRVLRALASVNVLKQVDLDSYAHTSMSRIWSSGHARASFRFKDEVYLTQSKLSAYFDERGFKNVTDHLDTPWGYARGVKGVDPFTLLARYPESHKAFNEAMVVDTELAARELCDTFPFDSLAPGESDVVLVDVGGGKGQTMTHVLKTFPGLRGRVVLEDLASVLHGERLMVEDERLQVQAYDFLSEEQPIKGAGAYFFKWIFHDWPDSTSLTILKHTAPAMRGHASSRLLICDCVVPDRNPPPRKTLRDINMLQYSGMERSYRQWDRLLKQAGFRIVHVHGLDNIANSIIEAKLEE